MSKRTKRLFLLLGLTLGVIGGAGLLFRLAADRPATRLASALRAWRELPTPRLVTRSTEKTKPSSSSQSAWVATNRDEIIARCLSSDELCRLEKTFEWQAVRPDPNVPLTRQVLLANRRIEFPTSRSFPASFSASQRLSVRRTVPFIVLFNQAVAADWASGVPGVIPRGYLPNRAWLTELTEDGLRRLTTLPEVQGVAEWLPSDKLSPFLHHMQKAGTSEDGRLLRMTVQTFAPEDVDEVAMRIQKASGELLVTSASPRRGVIQAAVPISALRELAQCGEVQWMEPAPEFRLSNHLAVQPGRMNVVTAWETAGLTGEGQIVGHADSGIDTGSLATMHRDFTNNVKDLLFYTTDNNRYDKNGHGTHTAGSIVGDGTLSDGAIRGVAWRAKLVDQRIVDVNGVFASVSLRTLFADAYERGARIHSDSWGVAGELYYGTYQLDCIDADEFTWDHPDFLPVFAAGNTGTDANSDGVVDLNSINLPAAAKNLLAVGATENSRPRNGQGYSSYTWLNFSNQWISDNEISKFSAEPLQSDCVVESADTENGRMGMAAFSARGPASDGRIKPDVVAPGSDVVSCRTSCNSFSLAMLYPEYNNKYVYMLGTSMSTPLAAGAAALIRQYVVSNTTFVNPSAALVKAMLVGGSRSITPGQYGTGAYREIPAASPNPVEGWGLLDVGETVSPSDPSLSIRLYDQIRISVGETKVFRFLVKEPGKPLDFVLDWIDYPATAGAAVALVNDYDLSVVCPDGTVRYPNGGNSPDRVNTVETVRLAAADAGVYEVRLTATTLPQEGGAVALYARGAFDPAQDNLTLTVRYRDAATDAVLYESFSYCTNATELSIPAAPDWFADEETNEQYAFCEWTLDGTRLATTNGVAVNPPNGVSMETNHVLEAVYLPFWQDENENFLLDWWEYRYYGTLQDSLGAGDDSDADGWEAFFEMLDNTDPFDTQSIPQLPSIVVEPLSVFQSERCPWTVRATVRDNFAITGVFLYWQEKGDAKDNWRGVAMTSEDGELFTAQLQPESYGRKRVDYFVVAIDLCGYYLGDYVSSPTYQVIGDYDTPWMRLTPTEEFPTLQLADETTNLSFTVENLAGADLVWTARVSESLSPLPTNGWSSGGQNNHWHLTTRRTETGDPVWYCGNEETGIYDNSCHAWLDTPAFQVGDRGGFTVRQWIATEFDDDQADNHYWDAGVVKVSTDGGATFTVIAPVGGYPDAVTSNPASPFVAEQPCFGSSSGVWQTVRFDLSDHAGETVIVRFEFGADAYTVAEGWYISSVIPYGFSGETPQWLRTEDASGGSLADGWSATCQLTIDSAPIEPNTEVTAYLLIESNDPEQPESFLPVTVQRGYRLTAEIAKGEGEVTPTSAFLFRNHAVSVTARANTNAYIYAILINGEPLNGEIFTRYTNEKELSFTGYDGPQEIRVYIAPRMWTLTIQTVRGDPIPAVGTHEVVEGVSVEASVSSPVMQGTAGNRRYTCTGWTLVEECGITNRGEGASVVLALTNSAVLTWEWANQFLVTIQTIGDGTVEPPSAWCNRSGDVSFTAQPGPYAHFVSWNRGTGRTQTYTTNGMTMTVTNLILPSTFIATFADNLTPTHRVPERWLAQYGFDGDWETAAEGDADGDGMETWKEWYSDTDPTNSVSVLTFLNFAFVDSTHPFAMWTGGSAVTQYVQYAETLAGPWTTFSTNLPPTAITNAIALPYAPAPRFYRIWVDER
ncbi:MAG: S8 family serine peptidase [Kiritimatiellae bacterium]|nr:S8 family serine peptidase [Kiritimatiellia bacterium]